MVNSQIPVSVVKVQRKAAGLLVHLKYAKKGLQIWQVIFLDFYYKVMI